MRLRPYRRRVLPHLLLCGHLALAAGRGLAQEPDADDVVVTGSRIPRSDFVPGAPIYTVGPDQVAGDPAPSSGGLSLPPVLRAGMAVSFDPALGGAVNDLRGFGPSRQLVMVDGRRPAQSASDLSVDLGAIPDALIDRIEVVSAPAAVSYGPQALAGAVNVRLKRDFAGVDLRAGTTSGGGADGWQISGLAGGGFAGDRGQALVAFDRTERDGLAGRVPDLDRQALYGRLRYSLDNGAELFGQADIARYGVSGGGETRLIQGLVGARGSLGRTPLTWEASFSRFRSRTTAAPVARLEQEGLEILAVGDLRTTRRGPVGVGFGLDARRQTYRADPRRATAREAAVWGEVRLPLMGDPMDSTLEFGLGYRRGLDRRRSGEAWKAELDWTPSNALRLRAAWQEVVRPPTLLELHGVQRVGTRLYLGSPDLVAERSDGWSLGAVASPFQGRWLGRLRLSAEAYGVGIDQAILAPTAGGVFANGGRVAVRGADLQAGWGFDLGWAGFPAQAGSVRTSLSLGRLERFKAAGSDRAGLSAPFALVAGPDFPGAAYPGWRAAWTLGYDAGAYDMALTGRYAGKVDGPLASGGRWAWDLSGGRRIGLNLELRGGVYNLSDQAPPYREADPTLYDPYGRRAFAQVRTRF